MQLASKLVETKPFLDQKPGTSGLRKKTRHFIQENYLENFIQSIFNVVVDNDNFTVVVGGDGRFYNTTAILKTIIPIAATDKRIKRIIVGMNGILSTPAVSHVIRKYKADGGILLTASHNPGGINEDFGVKYNIKNGGPAPEHVTDHIYEESKTISKYSITSPVNIDLSKLQKVLLTNTTTNHNLNVEIIDSVADYAEYMQEIFDFGSIKQMITGSDGLPKLRVLADALNGVMGVYVTEIFCKLLGIPQENADNCIPKEDFGGGHPDPNLTYAKALVDKMKSGNYDLGCAFDGDGDRNMILGLNGFFVTPCDSLAAVADNLECIPYFQKNGVFGYARSMPTSSAVDKVGQKKNLSVYEVPTGWKFFGNLMDAQKLSLCGEESFGMGSNHIREKDGMWAVLSWLSILSKFRRQHKRSVGIEEIMGLHWAKYGRNFFTRYDYENCTTDQGKDLMKVLTDFITDASSIGKACEALGKKYVVQLVDNFEYKDPIDKSVSSNQGIRVIFTDGSRLIYRLSGTGSSGATVRVYIDSYQTDPATFTQSAEQVLKPLVAIGLELCHIKKITGREAPTVIT